MPNRSPLSRRAVLAGGVGGLLVGGGTAACGVRHSGTTPPAAAGGSDSALVDEVGDAVALALARARSAARSGALRATAQPFVRLHAAHLRRLGWSGASPGTGRWTPGRDSLLGSEHRLQADLVRAAGEADSGALAQVLASMAAAVAQQVAVTA